MVRPDHILSPMASPTGPAHDDADTARAFAGHVYAGRSPRFHVEGPALMVDRLDAAALRIGPNAVLVRLDLDDDQLSAKPVVEHALAEAGMTRLDHDSLLAVPVAIQVLGLRISSWDLWGSELDPAYAALRAAAVGEPWNPVLAAGTPETGVL